MEFEQKAEEKKMSMSKNIARLAVTAGLTAALSFGGVMVPVSMAFAAEGAATTTNTITINKIAGNKDVKYKAYQIFKATVTDTENGKTAQDITWANDKLGAEVVKAIKEKWTGYNDLATNERLSENPTAQEVADFLRAHADSTTAGSDDGSIKGTRLATNNVLYAVANAVKDNASAVDGADTVNACTFSAQSSGYYLFVTSNLEVTKPNTGTSPIFAIVGGDPVVVTEKTSIPTINKEILNDSNENKQGGYTAQQGWSKFADSQIGQEVSYKLTGSIADNYATYDSYAYKFTDTLSQGLTYDKESLEVYALNGQSYTQISPKSYTVNNPTEDNNTLTVSFNDKGLKSATAAKESDTLNIDANTYIVVFYKAKLNSKANYDTAGNTNNVYLEYSNNPMAEGTGKSEIKGVTDHVFRLDVTKTDKGSGDVLKGEGLQAGFKVKVLEGDEGTLDNKWLGENGEIVDEGQAYEFMTRLNDGKVYIPGLDTGKYQITETTTPTGYNTVAPFEITITPTYKKTGELDTLTVSSNNEEMTTIGDANGATMSLTIKNKKGSGLPLTGLNGVTFTWIAGGAVLCIGVAHLIRSRKQAEESEQE